MDNLLPLTHARIERLREDESILHGIQLSVSFQGERIVDFAAGEARPGVEMTMDTICRQHCTGAPLTAFALAPLVARNEVGLDQPVSHFIPGFAAMGKDRVTLRHVLTHTAGLHITDEACFLHSEEETLALVCAAPLPAGWALGAKATYSFVAGWHVIGSVVEKVVGVPLREYLRATIFLPLSMSDTWVGMPPETYVAVRDRLGVTYFEWDEDSFERWLGVGPTPMWHDVSEETCTLTVPSSAYAPSRDLARFYEVLLDEATMAELGIVEPDTWRQFVSVQRSGMYDSGLARVCDYGLGFMVNVRGHHFGDYCLTGSYGHSGINGSSLAFADEENHLAIALLCNDVLDWQSCFLRRTAIVNAVYEDLGLTSRRADRIHR